MQKLEDSLLKTQLVLLILINPLFIFGGFLPGLFLVIFSFIYLLIVFKNKLSFDITNKYSIIFLTFNFILIISSFFSEHILLSFEYSLLYFRYGIFALGISYLFISKPKYLNYFLFSIVIFTLFVGLDALIQFITGNNLLNFPYDPHYRRLSGIFKDEQILGLYLFKLTPLILIYLYLSHKENLLFKIRYLIIIFSLFFFVTVSGERVSLVIFILFFLFYIIFSKKFLKQNLILLVILSIIFSISFIVKPNLYKRVIFETYDQITSPNEYLDLTIYSPGHTRHYITAYDIFKDNPLLGGGPKTYRVLCKNYPYDGCSTHPHNFIMQLLSEIGMIGLLFFFYMYISLLYITLKLRPKTKKDFTKEFFLILSSAILMIYFPFIPSNNFFHQWINIQNFVIFGLLIYVYKSQKI